VRVGEGDGNRKGEREREGEQVEKRTTIAVCVSREIRRSVMHDDVEIRDVAQQSGTERNEMERRETERHGPERDRERSRAGTSGRS